jgi:hypothetical protein
MSIFDDIPLEDGTVFFEHVILSYDPETRKYLVREHDGQSYQRELWLPREGVEKRHADFLCKGLQVTTIQPATPQSTRFYRRKERNTDDE